jgi:hypothetical protein
MKTVKLIRKRAGFRFRYYPNCEASIWLCDFLHRKSLTKSQIEGFRKHLGIQIDIDVQPTPSNSQS